MVSWRLGAWWMLPQCWDLAVFQPCTGRATGLRSFCLKPCQSVLASSKALRRGQRLTLKTAKAKMAGLRLLQILKLSRMQSLPSHPHSPVACNPGTKRPASALAAPGSTYAGASES